MPKRFSQKQILNACRMSFEGISNSEIAVMLNVTDTTVSNWRRLKIWQEFEAELVDAYKQQVLESGFTAPTLATPPTK